MAAYLQTTAPSSTTQRAQGGASPLAKSHIRCFTRLHLARRSQQGQELLPRRRRQSLAASAAAGAAAGAGSSSTATRPGDDYFASSDRRPIVLFDGVCNLCNGGVNFMLDWDREGAFRFAALQSRAGRALLQRSGRDPEDISSIVFVEPSGSYTKSAAILRIAERLRAPLPLVAAALGAFPGFFKDAVYDQVAGNRYSFFGRTQSCRLSDPRFEERFLY